MSWHSTQLSELSHKRFVKSQVFIVHQKKEGWTIRHILQSILSKMQNRKNWIEMNGKFMKLSVSIFWRVSALKLSGVKLKLRLRLEVRYLEHVDSVSLKWIGSRFINPMKNGLIPSSQLLKKATPLSRLCWKCNWARPSPQSFSVKRT